MIYTTAEVNDSIRACTKLGRTVWAKIKNARYEVRITEARIIDGICVVIAMSGLPIPIADVLHITSREK